jgi:hypothetical protein
MLNTFTTPKIIRRRRQASARPADTSNPFADAPVISVYTAEQAVDDGFLVDGYATEAREIFEGAFGGAPVYLTRALFELIEKAVAHPRWCNDWKGVAHDIVWMAKIGGALKAAQDGARAHGSGRDRFLVIITGTGRRRNHVLDAVIDGNGLTFCLQGED